MRRPTYYCVVDIEATCSEDESISRRDMEIIEIGAVMVNGANLEPIDEFQSFVRPVRNPKLTKFCMNLTSIRQMEVDTAPRFPDANSNLAKWLRHYSDYIFCSWGDYDRIQFERDCKWHRTAYPFTARHLNLRSAYAKKQSLNKPVGLLSALRRKNLRLNGTHHRGIDDARAVASLLPYIVG